MTQRDVALKLGVSQGCQKALIFKGWDKVHNFNQNKNMLGHVYRLTPAGIADEALFTARFLKREMLVEQELKVEVEMLKIVVTQSDNTLKHP